MSLEDGTKELKQDVFESEVKEGAKKQSYLVSNIIIICALIIVAGAWAFSYKMTNASGQVVESTQGDFSIRIPEEWTAEVVAPTEVNPVYGIFAANDTNDASIMVLALDDENAIDNENDAVDNVAYVYSQFGFEFISREGMNINGVDGVFFEANLADALGTYYQTGFIAIEDGVNYTVIAQTITDTVGETIDEYKDAVQSFTIIK